MTRLDDAIADLPMRYSGPGGAIAVLKDSVVLVRHSWGFANAEQRIAFTPATPFRICSITKQFICALLFETFADPSVLDPRVRAMLPRLSEPAPSTLHLCHNQSGLRDFWATAMLQGASAEGAFSDADASAIYEGTRTLQFRPGARFSYANQNFRLLLDIIAEAADEDPASLLRRRVFDAAGMQTAVYAPDSRSVPYGMAGYEGDVASGFRPAVNNIRLAGDGAIAASLDDLIAWERQIDRDRDDPKSLTGRLMAPVQFADGRSASYGFGLRRAVDRGGLRWFGHSGALRGWRCQRLYMPEQRLSVVVLFNHMADASAAALDVAFAALGVDAPVRPATTEPKPIWDGAYLDAQEGLLARIETRAEGQVRLLYGQAPEILDLDAQGARNALTRITASPDGLLMSRAADNSHSLLIPCTGSPRADVEGAYACAELGSELEIVEAGGIFYGAFSGRLGPGRLEQLEPVAEDLWLLPCPRALDHLPPGDWTLMVRRDPDGKLAAISVGCWLARGLDFERKPAASRTRQRAQA